jgi:tRNA pseudouridine38-40 synthase
MRLAFRLSYVGDNYYGSQMQPDRRTVEGVLIETCTRLGLFDEWRDSRFAFAGRTDRGVHARAQVCAFSTPHPRRAVEAINQCLPPDCWCTGWAEVDDDFHPRYRARKRCYRYFFPDTGFDVEQMTAAASLFIDSHDFSRFARIEDKNPVRTIISAEIIRENDWVVFEVIGESFLWNMVRCMATVLEEVGRGEKGTEEIGVLLAGGRGDRIAAAKPGGLVLWEVDCGVEFSPMALGRNREAFLDNMLDDVRIKGRMLEELRGSGLDFSGQELIDQELRHIV